ncbi:CAP domain-containing protein, partial [Streptomyces lunaelactis]
AKPSATPSKQTKAPEAQKEKKKESAAPARTESRASDRSATRPKAPVVSGAAAAEAAVLSLVNEERAKVGCSPVRANASLAALAGDFSDDMAA